METRTGTYALVGQPERQRRILRPELIVFGTCAVVVMVVMAVSVVESNNGATRVSETQEKFALNAVAPRMAQMRPMIRTAPHTTHTRGEALAARASYVVDRPTASPKEEVTAAHVDALERSWNLPPILEPSSGGGSPPGRESGGGGGSGPEDSSLGTFEPITFQQYIERFYAWAEVEKLPQEKITEVVDAAFTLAENGHDIYFLAWTPKNPSNQMIVEGVEGGVSHLIVVEFKTYMLFKMYRVVSMLHGPYNRNLMNPKLIGWELIKWMDKLSPQMRVDYASFKKNHLL